MFNRQPFNRGKFDTLALNHRSVYFYGNISMNLEAEGDVNAIRALKGDANTAMLAEGKINIIKALKGSADAILFADGKLCVVRDFKGNADSRMIVGGNIIRARNLGSTYGINTYNGFNRLPFDRGRFNVSSYRNNKAILRLSAAGIMNTVSTFKGNSEIVLNMEGRANYVSTFRGETGLYLHANGRINAILPLKGSANVLLSASGRYGVIRALKGVAISVLQVSSKGFNTYRYEYIKFPNIVIKPGDELIIDTDAMTATLNGQNVVQYLSRDSEFFLFNPHENDIIYKSGNANDKVDIKILWKDAYL